MSHTSYHSVTNPRRRSGFWLKTRRFLIIPRLRVDFFYYFRSLFKCKSKFSLGQALKWAKRGIPKFKDGDEDNLRRRIMVSTGGGASSRSYYYASSDAISDCLEYIKTSGVASSADEKTPLAAESKQDKGWSWFNFSPLKLRLKVSAFTLIYSYFRVTRKNKWVCK